MSKEAMKQALEALEKNFESLVSGVTHAMTVNAINAIREALADIGNPITEQLSIPTVITCPFCASEHVPGWLHDLNMDRGAYGERPAQRKPLTDERVVAAARVLSDRVAAQCGIDVTDQWMLYGNDFIEDARAMLEAAHGITKGGAA